MSGPSLATVVGVGARHGAPLEEGVLLVEAALASCHLGDSAVTTVVTSQRRAGEPAIGRLAAQLGAELVGYPVEVLAAQQVPHPSELVKRHTGLDGVAEAAVLTTGARLVGARTSSASWTVAVGQHECGQHESGQHECGGERP